MVEKTGVPGENHRPVQVTGEGGREGVSDNSSIFQLLHVDNKLIFNDMMMRSALYYTNTLSLIFIVLLTETTVHDRHVATLGHIILIPS